MHETDSNSSERKIVGQFSVRSLLGGQLLDRPDIERPDIYQKLGDMPLAIFESKEGSNRVISIERINVTGSELNALLHYAAPSRRYGIDKGDLLKDWVDIYKPENTELLKRHVEKFIGPENWRLFEKVKDQVWDLINGGSGVNVISPIIKLTTDGTNGWKWDFDGDSMQVLGPAFIAAFSPDITTTWAKRIGQDMGTTQALPLTLMKKDDLLGSVLIKQVTGLVETGVIPELPVATQPIKTETQTTPTTVIQAEDLFTPIPMDTMDTADDLKFLLKELQNSYDYSHIYNEKKIIIKNILDLEISKNILDLEINKNIEPLLKNLYNPTNNEEVNPYPDFDYTNVNIDYSSNSSVGKNIKNEPKYPGFSYFAIAALTISSLKTKMDKYQQKK